MPAGRTLKSLRNTAPPARSKQFSPGRQHVYAAVGKDRILKLRAAAKRSDQRLRASTSSGRIAVEICRDKANKPVKWLSTFHCGWYSGLGKAHGFEPALPLEFSAL